MSMLGVKSSLAREPVAFNLPGLDPANVLLSPILAHEVGHSVQLEYHLVESALAKGDSGALDALQQQCLSEAAVPDAAGWKAQLSGWIEEVLCDVIATVLTGPSMLFASAAFLPAPDVRPLGTHPPPSDRIGIIIELLRSDGWLTFLQPRCPTVLAWLDQLAARTAVTDPRERFLRESLDMLTPALIETARQHVGTVFTATEYAKQHDDLTKLLDARVPPSQLHDSEVSSWSLVLCAWLFAFKRDGDNSDTLASAVADREFNRFVLKAIELARLVELWDDNHEPA